MSLSTKTGAAASDQSIPATMKINFDDFGIEMNGNKLPLPMEKLGQSISVEGSFDKNGAFQSESANGKAVSDSVRQKVKQMTNGFQKNINFPDHPMKIGESFTQGLPFNLPMTGNNVKIDARTVYTLTKFESGNAYFDVVPNLNIVVPIKGNTLTITATGTGKMIYSVKDNFATEYTMTMNLKVAGEIARVTIDATADLQMGYKTTVTAN